MNNLKNESLDVMALQLQTVLSELELYHAKYVESERRNGELEAMLKEKNKKLHKLSQRKKAIAEKLAEAERKNLELKQSEAAIPENLGGRQKKSRSTNLLKKLIIGEKSEAKKIRMIKQCSLFDADWYLEKYPDVKASGMDPVKHFLTYGLVDQRDPGPEFSTEWYIKANPSILAEGVNPLIHYLQHKVDQGAR